jgi:hypothetical protein
MSMAILIRAWLLKAGAHGIGGQLCSGAFGNGSRISQKS